MALDWLDSNDIQLGRTAKSFDIKPARVCKTEMFQLRASLVFFAITNYTLSITDVAIIQQFNKMRPTNNSSH